MPSTECGIKPQNCEISKQLKPHYCKHTHTLIYKDTYRDI